MHIKNAVSNIVIRGDTYKNISINYYTEYVIARLSQRPRPTTYQQTATQHIHSSQLQGKHYIRSEHTYRQIHIETLATRKLSR